MQLPDVVNEEEHQLFNEILSDDEAKEKHQDFQGKANLLREKHRELRDGYDHLERSAATGPKNEEFVEPKVQGLWQAAIENNFSGDQLAALKVRIDPFSWQCFSLTIIYFVLG